MNLANDNAFSTVNNKSAAFSHKRNVAHVNVFLQNGTGILKIQADSGLEGNGIGKSLSLAFKLAEFNVFLVQFIVVVFKGHVVVRTTFNRECGSKNFLQTLVQERLALVQPFFLNEFFVG